MNIIISLDSKIEAQIITEYLADFNCNIVDTIEEADVVLFDIYHYSNYEHYENIEGKKWIVLYPGSVDYQSITIMTFFRKKGADCRRIGIPFYKEELIELLKTLN